METLAQTKQRKTISLTCLEDKIPFYEKMVLKIMESQTQRMVGMYGITWLRNYKKKLKKFSSAFFIQ